MSEENVSRTVPETQNIPAAAPESAHSQQPCCPQCAATAPRQESYVYAIGRISVKFPSLALEREFKQRETAMRLPPGEEHNQRISKVLEENGHLAAKMCYLLTIGGVPAYILAPGGPYLRKPLFEAIALSEEAEAHVVVIGRVTSMAPPHVCAGILAPILVCDQMYVFHVREWLASLTSSLEPALSERKIDRQHFGSISRRIFSRVVRSTENVGATDSHRALNYLVIQHPGIFLAAVERASSRELDRIDTQLIQGASARKQVAVILSFLDPTTGVAERLFTRVDVTEEWPFVADVDGGQGPLGLQPYIESSLFGMPI
jgi:hypothetical protein